VAFQLHRQTIDAGLIELAPTTVLTVRSTVKIISAVELPDVRRFGDIRLSRLNWQDIESLHATMRGAGKSAAYIRRCATVLARALDLARKRGLIDSNPAKDATRPRTTRSKPYAPTGGEVRAVLAKAASADLTDRSPVEMSCGNVTCNGGGQCVGHRVTSEGKRASSPPAGAGTAPGPDLGA